MSSLTIERTFSVDAPPDRVWSYLTDPALVVTCLPGAALESSSEDGLVHEGTVTVKLGTIRVSYHGRAEFVEVDEERRKLGVRAKGREKTGAGSADMSMRAQVLASGNGSEVSIEADVHVTGKLVSLGRGMIDVVSAQLVKDFATSLCRKVSAPPEAREGDQATDPRPVPDETDRAAPPSPRPANALSIFLRAVWTRLARLFEPD